MTDKEGFIHFVAGASGGTAGTAMTCPLEVVKVRLQSSRGCAINGGSGDGLSGQSSSTRIVQPSRGVRNMIPEMSSFVVRSTPLPNESFHTRIGKTKLFGRFNAHIVNGANTNCCYYRTGVSASSSRSFSLITQLLLRQHTKTLLTDIRKMSTAAHKHTLAIFGYMRQIAKTEGYSALWKGLGPNLIGVAPSKAVYFYSYSNMKKILNEVFVPNTPIVHLCSAGFSGFLAATVVNPVWLVKTRLQLDRHSGQGRLTVVSCIKNVYKTDRLKGFYRGVTASYAGISETVLQFVIYERLRTLFVTNNESYGDDRRKTDFLRFMMCGGVAKLCATMLTYPHEVVRTRLREEGNKYKGFWKTLILVGREEGRPGLYRGLTVQLMRTVPNTAITMGTYELVVYLLTRLSNQPPAETS